MVQSFLIGQLPNGRSGGISRAGHVPWAIITPMIWPATKRSDPSRRATLAPLSVAEVTVCLAAAADNRSPGKSRDAVPVQAVPGRRVL